MAIGGLSSVGGVQETGAEVENPMLASGTEASVKASTPARGLAAKTQQPPLCAQSVHKAQQPPSSAGAGVMSARESTGDGPATSATASPEDDSSSAQASDVCEASTAAHTSSTRNVEARRRRSNSDGEARVKVTPCYAMAGSFASDIE